MIRQKDSSAYYSATHFCLYIPFAVIYSLFSQLLVRPRIKLLSPSSTPAAGVAIVTGSNTGIGFETARSLIQSARFSTVILACRSRDKGEAAVEKLRKESASCTATDVAFVPLDLSDMDSVVKFCDTICQTYKRSVRLLVNNAGCNSGGDLTTDGFESLFQTNFLGHFVLTLRLIDTDSMAPKARIVNLSSVMHHFCGPVSSAVDFWKAVAQEKRGDGYQYALSKLAAILFTIELNKRYTSITSYAVNPGAVNSDIWRDLPGFVRWIFTFFYLTNAQGCKTTVAASLLDDLPFDCVYLQPYWLPRKGTPFPMYEMLGPFQGHRITPPRLPAKGTSEAMWSAFEAITLPWLESK